MAQRTLERGRDLNWSAVSEDYLRHRNGYPPSFFALLKVFGVGLPGQRIVDLGTGTGNLAVPFAAQGAVVTGVDPSPGQIAAARRRSAQEKVRVDWVQAPAEASGLPDASADAVTASMCWNYLEPARAVPEVLRILAPGGVLLLSSIVWRARPGDVASRSNALIARYNPRFFQRQSGGGEEEPDPDWARGRLRLTGFRSWHEPLRFTREGWLGRIRASKWIGAALEPERAADFDQEHRELLRREPAEFEVEHRIGVRLFGRPG